MVRIVADFEVVLAVGQIDVEFPRIVRGDDAVNVCLYARHVQVGFRRKGVHFNAPARLAVDLTRIRHPAASGRLHRVARRADVEHGRAAVDAGAADLHGTHHVGPLPPNADHAFLVGVDVDSGVVRPQVVDDAHGVALVYAHALDNRIHQLHAVGVDGIRVRIGVAVEMLRAHAAAVDDDGPASRRGYHAAARRIEVAERTIPLFNEDGSARHAKRTVIQQGAVQARADATSALCAGRMHIAARDEDRRHPAANAAADASPAAGRVCGTTASAAGREDVSAVDRDGTGVQILAVLLDAAGADARAGNAAVRDERAVAFDRQRRPFRDLDARSVLRTLLAHVLRVRVADARDGIVAGERQGAAVGDDERRLVVVRRLQSQFLQRDGDVAARHDDVDRPVRGIAGDRMVAGRNREYPGAGAVFPAGGGN